MALPNSQMNFKPSACCMEIQTHALIYQGLLSAVGIFLKFLNNKNKHDHIETHMQNMSVIVELLYGTCGKKERKSE
jgi:hypothetical protein